MQPARLHMQHGKLVLRRFTMLNYLALADNCARGAAVLRAPASGERHRPQAHAGAGCPFCMIFDWRRKDGCMHACVCAGLFGGLMGAFGG